MELSVADNGDGTGGVVTVSDNAGETASVYTSRFTGTNASRAFALAGTVVGNDTLNLSSVELGPYITIASNTAIELSAPIFFRLTDSTLALHQRCLDAVREYIMSLTLPAVSTDADDHYIVKLPYRPDMELDLKNRTDFGMFYFPVPETYGPANNEEDSVSYSVQVVMIRRIGQRLSEGLADLLKARELMGQSMSICPLPDVDEIHTVNVQPGAVLLPERWLNGYDASSVVFRCLTEQPAGIF